MMKDVLMWVMVVLWFVMIGVLGFAVFSGELEERKAKRKAKKSKIART